MHTWTLIDAHTHTTPYKLSPSFSLFLVSSLSLSLSLTHTHTQEALKPLKQPVVCHHRHHHGGHLPAAPTQPTPPCTATALTMATLSPPCTAWRSMSETDSCIERGVTKQTTIYSILQMFLGIWIIDMAHRSQVCPYPIPSQQSQMTQSTRDVGKAPR